MQDIAALRCIGRDSAQLSELLVFQLALLFVLIGFGFCLSESKFSLKLKTTQVPTQKPICHLSKKTLFLTHSYTKYLQVYV